MTQPVHRRIQVGGLDVAEVLYDLVANYVMPGTGIHVDAFWQSLAECLTELGPRNRDLLDRRDRLQAQIDDWHRQHADTPHDPMAYKRFLQDIGYLLPEGDDFTITTDNLDPEVSSLAGPQLVVPVMNARYALNAANARWGSLYDSLYGTDVISRKDGADIGKAYNPVRGERVVSWAMGFLDETFSLEKGGHGQVNRYTIEQGRLLIELSDGEQDVLSEPGQCVGYAGDPDQPSAILLRNNGLHVELQIDREHPIGQTHPAGIKDIVMEAAVTTIQDCEDSVATVDAEDKAQVYGNWLGLMKGDLADSFQKDGKMMTRRLHADREYRALDGSVLTLPGRSLMLVRNVGHHMYTDAILDGEGHDIPEGILDGFITALISLHDLKGTGPFRNSPAGSVYIVKPKMHGPDEVAFTDTLFARIEDALGMARYTLKMGIMDEERRTSLNLKECIRAARQRVVFINTGFLDRTGDEIHTSMVAGPVVAKGDMKQTAWIEAYEDANVDTGLACGLQGKAQIGKGMWAMPDEMAAMLEQKVAHPLAGASTAWVPSPTAAVLHAIHYHRVRVADRQDAIRKRPRASIDDMLTLPLLGDQFPGATDIQQELDNNTQSILGYVVRWIDQGTGCSKVPNIHDIGLMEDRATLRISSQHVANWLQHGLCSETQVMDTLKRMAWKVDEQNRNDPTYRNMAPDFDSSLAFQAARDLIFRGAEQPNGYTEFLLNVRRRQAKARAGVT